MEKVKEIKTEAQGYGMAITVSSEQLDNFRKGMELHGGKVYDFIIRVDDNNYRFDLKDLEEFCANKK